MIMINNSKRQNSVITGKYRLSTLLRVPILLVYLLITGIASSAELQPFEPDGAKFGEFLGKGKWLIVEIWASDCSICNREAHQYVDYYEFQAGDRATVVGISLDGENEVEAKDYIERHEVTYPNFITDFETGSQWFFDITGRNFSGTPGFLIFDPTGELRAQEIGAVPVEVIDQFIDSNS